MSIDLTSEDPEAIDLTGSPIYEPRRQPAPSSPVDLTLSPSPSQLESKRPLQDQPPTATPTKLPRHNPPVDDGGSGVVDVMKLLRRCLEEERWDGMEKIVGVERSENECVDVVVSAISGPCVMINSQKGDRGWGCGWRNIQMLISHFIASDHGGGSTSSHSAELDSRTSRLFDGRIPTLEELQQSLEESWSAGFDVVGAEQLSWKVVGTKKWVGATECAALLRYKGLQAEIVDFHGNTHPSASRNVVVECDGCGASPINLGSFFRSLTRKDFDLCSDCLVDGRHAIEGERFQEMKPTVAAEDQTSTRKHASLMDWVWRYFTSEVRMEGACTTSTPDMLPKPIDHAGHPRAEVLLSGKTPLYFQHQGHSRTVVGVQRKLNKFGRPISTCLLVLDPSTQSCKYIEKLSTGRAWQQLVKKGLENLNKEQYQLVYVDKSKGIVDPRKRGNLKILRPIETYDKR